MSALEAIIEHYKKHERQHIDVPEWGAARKPLRIYWMLLTVSERLELLRNAESDAHVLVAKARDGNGARMFQPGDELKIMRCADSAIVTRIANAMLGGARVSESAVEQAEKNSEAIPSG